MANLLLSIYFNQKIKNSLVDQSVLKTSHFHSILGFAPNRAPKFSNKPQIIILGDSVAFGHLHKREDTIEALIQKKVKDKYHVVNLAGVAFNSTQSYLNLLLHQDKIKKDDQIIWINGPNDIRENMYGEFLVYRPNLYKDKEGFCFSPIPTKRYPGIYRRPSLNLGESLMAPLLMIQEKLEDNHSILLPDNIKELRVCTKDFEITNGEDVLVELNKRVHGHAKEKGVLFTSILIPSAKTYEALKEKQNVSTKNKLQSFGIKTIDINEQTKDMSYEQIFLKSKGSNDDHLKKLIHLKIMELY